MCPRPRAHPRWKRLTNRTLAAEGTCRTRGLRPWPPCTGVAPGALQGARPRPKVRKRKRALRNEKVLTEPCLVERTSGQSRLGESLCTPGSLGDLRARRHRPRGHPRRKRLAGHGNGPASGPGDLLRRRTRTENGPVCASAFHCARKNCQYQTASYCIKTPLTTHAREHLTMR